MQEQIAAWFDESDPCARLDEPSFISTLCETMNGACFQSFLRVEPHLPVRARDFHLSKLLQFMNEAISARFPDMLDSLVVLQKLEKALGEIEGDRLRELLDNLSRKPDSFIERHWWHAFVDLCERQETVERLLQAVPEFVCQFRPAQPLIIEGEARCDRESRLQEFIKKHRITIADVCRASQKSINPTCESGDRTNSGNLL